MLTAEDLKVVLASPSLRQAHGLELPEASLRTLATDEPAFATFYQQWTAQGQPRYVPPEAAVEPVAEEPVAPVAPPQPPAPVAPTPVAPTPVAPFATPAIPPVPVAPSPYGPPPVLPTAANPLAQFSRDPAARAAALGNTPQPPVAGAYPPNSPYSPYPGYASPNAVAPRGSARPGLAMMLWGFGIAFVGIIVTAVTWLTAAPGGTFVVAWGAIIFGTIRGIIGTVHMSRGR